MAREVWKALTPEEWTEVQEKRVQFSVVPNNGKICCRIGAIVAYGNTPGRAFDNARGKTK